MLTIASKRYVVRRGESNYFAMMLYDLIMLKCTCTVLTLTDIAISCKEFITCKIDMQPSVSAPG